MLQHTTTTTREIYYIIFEQIYLNSYHNVKQHKSCQHAYLKYSLSGEWNNQTSKSFIEAYYGWHIQYKRYSLYHDKPRELATNHPTSVYMRLKQFRKKDCNSGNNFAMT